MVPNRDGSSTHEPPHPILAQGKVQYVGDHVVVVIAESLKEAKAAAELVEISYKELSPVVDLSSASVGAEIHEGMTSDRYFDWELGDEKATEAALKNAAKVVKLKVRNNRVIPNAMEPAQLLLNMMILPTPTPFTPHHKIHISHAWLSGRLC